MPLSQAEKERIVTWLRARSFGINDGFVQKVEIHFDLIRSWSSRMNLVSQNDLSLMITRHLFDSLAPLNEIPENCNVIDIGSGSGFPAIPLALSRPNAKFTLVESVHKKVLFLKKLHAELGINNLEIVEIRLESYQPTVEFDVALVRALPRWEKHLDRIKEIVKPDGKIIYFERVGYYKIIAPR